MGSPTYIPAGLTPNAILTKLRSASKAIATQVFQFSPPADLAPGAAVAVAQDPAALSRAVHFADPPPPGVETILQAQMFS